MSDAPDAHQPPQGGPPRGPGHPAPPGWHEQAHGHAAHWPHHGSGQPPLHAYGPGQPPFAALGQRPPPPGTASPGPHRFPYPPPAAQGGPPMGVDHFASTGRVIPSAHALAPVRPMHDPQLTALEHRRHVPARETVRALHGGDLRGCCVKCGDTNAPEERTADLRWLPPAAYLSLLLGVFVAAAAAALLTRRSEIKVSLCRRCAEDWDAGGREYRLSLLTAVAAAIAGGGALAVGSPMAGVALMFGGPLFAISGAYIAMKKRLTAVRIDREGVEFEGAVPGLIERLIPKALPPAAPDA